MPLDPRQRGKPETVDQRGLLIAVRLDVLIDEVVRKRSRPVDRGGGN
ncbi:hypothetical protein QP162_20140 [Sphingomonas aurantiaca]